MRKNIIIVFILLLLLSGCTSAPVPDDCTEYLDSEVDYSIRPISVKQAYLDGYFGPPCSESAQDMYKNFANDVIMSSVGNFGAGISDGTMQLSAWEKYLIANWGY